MIVVIDPIIPRRHARDYTTAHLEDVGVILDSLRDVGVIHKEVIVRLIILQR